MYDLQENFANLNDIGSKRSSSRFFPDHNLHPRLTGFVHAFIFFFPSNNSFF